MQPAFKTIPEMKVVGMKTKFIAVDSPDKNNMIVIPKLWQEYMPRRHEIKNTTSEYNLGVTFDIPANENARSDEMNYLAGTQVSNFDHIPSSMDKIVIPAGNCAVFTHKGELEKFGDTMMFIFGSWLPQSGKKMRNAPIIEMYDERFKLNQPDSEIDVYIPIE
jgi:AraC family transcriptional regulator